LDEASAQARIPARYLAAMESGDRSTLPPGPFRQGYQRQYLEFLGVDPHAQVADQPSESSEPTQTITVAIEEAPLGRLVMSGFVLTMVVVLLLRVLFELSEIPPEPSNPTLTAGATVEELAPPVLPQGAMPVSRLRIRAIEPTRITTRVDDEDSYQGRLPAGEIIDLEGAQRIEVFTSDLTTIRITYNGERIEPLGNLSKPRRLVFVQD
jgi:hypothetical protein